MWKCDECGCIGIAEDVEFCPQCFKPRTTPDGSAAPSGPEQASGSGVPRKEAEQEPQIPVDKEWKEPTVGKGK